MLKEYSTKVGSLIRDPKKIRKMARDAAWFFVSVIDGHIVRSNIKLAFSHMRVLVICEKCNGKAGCDKRGNLVYCHFCGDNCPMTSSHCSCNHGTYGPSWGHCQTPIEARTFLRLGLV
jgi:hypothetical protein